MTDQEQNVTLKIPGIRWMWCTLVVTVLALCAVLVLLVHQRGKTISALRNTQQAVAYVCNTSAVLDFIVVQSASQTQSELDDGTVARLQKQGLLTKKNVATIKKDLHFYNLAHAFLQKNKACENVTVAP